MRDDQRWAGRLGGLAMIALCVVPFVLAELAPHNMSLVVTGTRDSGLTFDYGILLCSIPGVLAAAFLAPLAGRSRWIALAFAVPIANLYLAWIIGRRAGRSARRPGTPG